VHESVVAAKKNQSGGLQTAVDVTITLTSSSSSFLVLPLCFSNREVGEPLGTTAASLLRKIIIIIFFFFLLQFPPQPACFSCSFINFCMLIMKD
jgi:hypothetical protein